MKKGSCVIPWGLRLAHIFELYLCFVKWINYMWHRCICYFSFSYQMKFIISKITWLRSFSWSSKDVEEIPMCKQVAKATKENCGFSHELWLKASLSGREWSWSGDETINNCCLCCGSEVMEEMWMKHYATRIGLWKPLWETSVTPFANLLMAHFKQDAQFWISVLSKNRVWEWITICLGEHDIHLPPNAQKAEQLFLRVYSKILASMPLKMLVW